MLLPELREEIDRHLEQPLPRVTLRRDDGLGEKLERALVVAGPERLEHVRQLARVAQLRNQPLACLRTGDAVEEVRHERRRPRADELVDDVAVAERLDRGDAL